MNLLSYIHIVFSACRFKPVLLLLLLLLLSCPGWGNDVRVVGNVKVLPSSIVDGKMASFDVMVEWDNSWRDEFNYDAVYIFLKYKYNAAGELWNHLYLGDQATVKGTDGTPYDCRLINSRGAANLNEGILVWRKGAGFGKSSVQLSLKWDITSGDRKLDYAAFNSGKVFLSAMAIEMVYVPQGAFRAGDSQAGTHFHHKYMPIPEEWDIVSEGYRILTKNNVVNAANPPAFAANHMNDIDRTQPTNAWVGDKSADQIWCIDFGAGHARTVRYLAIEGLPGYVPAAWELWGKNEEDGADAVRLFSGTASDWSTDAHRVYPATKALEIPSPRAYRFYELRFTNLGSANGPALKTVAMCEVNLREMYDNSVLISEEQTTLTGKAGLLANHLYTEESDMQSGMTTTVYPNGYVGFFAMKYEISQEQYVAFLNKLTLAQQVNRTTGESMVSLEPGQYVFGADRDHASFRNGIILASRKDTESPLVFANDLDRGNGGYNLDGDGQTLACNYLSPGDMLSYADWTGLRPLSELEYEKLCRQPFPAVPQRGEYAWNSTILTEPSGFVAGSEGTSLEGVSAGNVNMGGLLGGPVRCGAFAGASASQEAAGAGYWGAMELSGNLAEIYYNVNTEGRKFSGIPRNSHGDGSILLRTGESDINAGTWPIHGKAFALRGGGFRSARAELESSDRSRAVGEYEPGLINVRKEDVTFRLGCTMAQTRLHNVLTLQNGQTTASSAVADTIWTGDDYLIQGEIPEQLRDEYYTIAWFFSGDNGATWDLVEGENSKDLVLKNLRHIHVNTAYKEYRYRCEMYSCVADAKSYQVVIRVMNNKVEVINRELSVNVANASATITLRSAVPMTPKWTFKDKPPKDVLYTLVQGKEYLHTPLYQDFEYEGKVQTGRQPLVFRYYYATYLSPLVDTVWVNVIAAPDVTDDPANVVCGQPFNDKRGGVVQTYNSVAIGKQCWMVENLNYAVSGSRCYNDDANNCARYGRLYNWHQATGGRDNTAGSEVLGVQGACPSGWHLPTDAEWGTMYAAAGSNEKNLKSPLWGISANSSGFSALPGGGLFYAYSGSYATFGGLNSRSGWYDLGVRGWWWTSTNNIRGWYTGSNSGGEYNCIMMPYYTRIDDNNDATYFRNTDRSWSTYPSLNSIFCGGSHYYVLASYCNSSGIDSGYNANARDAVRQNFYFSVRCVRNTVLQEGE